MLECKPKFKLAKTDFTCFFSESLVCVYIVSCNSWSNHQDNYLVARCAPIQCLTSVFSWELVSPLCSDSLEHNCWSCNLLSQSLSQWDTEDGVENYFMFPFNKWSKLRSQSITYHGVWQQLPTASVALGWQRCLGFTGSLRLRYS